MPQTVLAEHTNTFRQALSKNKGKHHMNTRTSR
jgi:hypothetical protein